MPGMSAMKVAIYARVSSDRQDVNLSVSAQLKALREFAERNDHSVVVDFVDEAETGRNIERPQFRRMITMARCQPKLFEAILVYKYSRFARSREDSIVVKAMLRKLGVQIISITEPHDDTPTGKLMEAIIESLDEFYSENLGEEVTRGMRESASRGFYLSARPPYGYRKVKVLDGSRERTKLEVEPDRSRVVKAVFADVLSGCGLKEIIKDLNQRGVDGPTGRGWGKTGLYKILTNEICIGVQTWGRDSKRGLEPVRVANACPAIIDRDTYEKVQGMLKGRAPRIVHPKRTASRYLLSGIAKCGHCGKALVGQDAKSGKFAYYVCGTLLKRGAGTCPAKYLSKDKFEAMVIEQIKRHILTTDNLTQLVRMVNEEMDAASAGYNDEINRVAREITETETRLGRLYEALETGQVVLADLAPRIKELRTRYEQLQLRRIELETVLSDRRVHLADLKTVTAYVKYLHRVLNESPFTERRAFITSFVKEVRVEGNEAVIEYTIPMPPSQLSEEKVGVLPIVQYGGPHRTVPELLFEKKQLIPALQQLLVSHCT